MTTKELEDITGVKIKPGWQFVFTDKAVYGKQTDGEWLKYKNYEEAKRCSGSSENTTSG